MSDVNKNKNKFENKKSGNEKNATNNQWVSTGLKPNDNRERRDGPGGENAKR